MRIDVSFPTRPSTASTDQNSKSYPRKTVGGASNFWTQFIQFVTRKNLYAQLLLRLELQYFKES